MSRIGRVVQPEEANNFEWNAAHWLERAKGQLAGQKAGAAAGFVERMFQLRGHDIERDCAFILRGRANFTERGDSGAKSVQFALRRFLRFEKSIERFAQIALPFGKRARFAEFASAQKSRSTNSTKFPRTSVSEPSISSNGKIPSNNSRFCGRSAQPSSIRSSPCRQLFFGECGQAKSGAMLRVDPPPDRAVVHPAANRFRLCGCDLKTALHRRCLQNRKDFAGGETPRQNFKDCENRYR